jgi:hypothetical protein
MNVQDAHYGQSSQQVDKRVRLIWLADDVVKEREGGRERRKIHFMFVSIQQHVIGPMFRI